MTDAERIATERANQVRQQLGKAPLDPERARQLLAAAAAAQIAAAAEGRVVVSDPLMVLTEAD